MLSEEIILSCPYCQVGITRPLIWFNQTYMTCPACAGGLSAAQFSSLVAELDQAFDSSIEQLLLGEPEQGCSDHSGSCCGSGCGSHPPA